MDLLEAECILSPIANDSDPLIVKIEYDTEILKIVLEYGENDQKLTVIFDSPIGFRVLDERDLLEFWPKCSMPYGWVFKILKCGWLDYESKRDGFLTSSFLNHANML